MEKHERIWYAIRQSGKRKNEIAKLCHVAPAAVTHWTSGPKAIRDENLFSLARATGFRAEWLSLGTGPQKDPRIQGQGEVIGLVTALDADKPVIEDDVGLPYYEQVELAVGSSVVKVVEIAERKLRFSRKTLKVAGVEPSCAAIARLKGRAMEKLILDGAAIGFDTSFNHVVDGEIYAFDQGGMLRVQFLYKLPGGDIRIRSVNSDDYPDELVTREDFTRIKMLGRVFWWPTIRRAPPR